MATTEAVIVVHGGAGAHSLIALDNIKAADVKNGVNEAAKSGYRVLTSGGSAVDAVEAAVASMEDNPIFNAGRGSFLTIEETLEMDAGIMDGATLKTGAVACINNVTNPIKVAKAVMEKTDHTMFASEGAKTLASRLGFELVSTESLITERVRKRLQIERRFTHEIGQVKKIPNEHDTVGAVALDKEGNVAFATSTGGISGKMCGRVGDSPIVGSGGYADNASGAVTCTGDGEAFVKMCSAKHAAILMEQGMGPQQVVEEVLLLMKTRTTGQGGCIAINPAGDIGIHFNTRAMAWTTIRQNVLEYGLYKDDKITENFTEG